MDSLTFFVAVLLSATRCVAAHLAGFANLLAGAVTTAASCVFGAAADVVAGLISELPGHLSADHLLLAWIAIWVLQQAAVVAVSA